MNQFPKDFYRMTGRELKWTLGDTIAYVLHHNLRYIHLWRRYKKAPNPFLRLRLYRYTLKYGLEISPGAIIGDGLYVGHPYNITVADGVNLGKNVNLHKGCTIGRENRGERIGTPTIGDCVSVGINATIVGNITIGDDVLIAPNSFVNFNVPSHSVVIGNPAVVHSRADATESYVCFRI